MNDVTYPLTDDFAWQVLEALGQGVTIVDAQNRFEYANPAYLRMIGMSLAQLRGMTPFDFAPPDDVPRLEQVRRLRREGHPSTYEARLRRPDGSVLHTLITGVPRYQDGAFAGSFAIITDLTAQKQTEQALRDSEARYRRLVELSPDPIAVLVEGELHFANAAAATLLGAAAPEALVGKQANELAPTEDPVEIGLRLQAAYQTGKMPLTQVTLRALDGTARQVEVTASAIPYAGKTALQFVARDITERLQAQEAYQTLVDNSLQGLVIIQDLRIVFANEQTTQLSGYSVAELLAMPTGGFLERVYEADRQAVQAYLQGHLWDEPVPTRMELRILRPDDATAWVEVHTRRINYRNRAAVQVAFVDISERKQAEMAEQEQQALMAALRDTAAALNSTLELDDIFDRILANVGRVAPHTGAVIMLADAGIGRVVRIAGAFTSFPDAHLVLQLRMGIAQSRLLSHMNSTQQPLLIAATAGHPMWRERPGLEWVRSYAGAPICVQQQTIGFLHLLSDEPHFFTLAYAERLQAFADHVGVALRNARLFDEIRQRNRRLALINQLSMTMNVRLELGDVLQSAVDGLAQVVEGVEIGVALFDERSQNVHIEATYPPLPQGKAIELELPAAQIATVRQLEAGQMLVVTDTEQEPLLDDELRALLSRWLVRSLVLTPLNVRNAVIGCICYVSIAVPRQFSQEEQDLMRIVSNLVATRIDLAHILTAERRRRQELEAVQRASLSLTASLDLQRVLNAILQALLDLVAATVAGISLYDDGLLTFELTRPAAMLRQTPEHSPYQRRFADLIAQTGAPAFIEDNHQHPLWADRLPAAPHYAMAGLPLQIEAQIVGVLTVSYPGPHFFSESEKRILTLLAAQAAVAIQNARLHAQAQAYAQELEQRVSQRTVELEEERNRLQAILDAAGEAIYFTDAQNTIRYANPATQRITGYRPEELVGQPGERWHSHTPAAVRAELEARLRQGQSWQGEVINQRQDGSLYHASLMLNPLHTAAGELAGFVGVQRDISQIKELARLREAFVSQIGHEMQTPLTNLQIYLDLLERGRPEKQQAYLDVLRQTTIRLHKLIRGFLELSRVAADSAPVLLTPVDVGTLVADLATAYKAAAAARGIQIACQLPPRPERLLVLGEPAMLPQLLAQLIDNALEYSSTGGQVTLSAAAQPAGTQTGEPRWVTISVTDTGPGISVVDLPHVFERFYRGEAAADYTIPGAGLGLTICAEIARKLGGRIGVDSRPGEGSTFTVWLQGA